MSSFEASLSKKVQSCWKSKSRSKSTKMTVSFDFENDFSVALFFLAVNVITWVRFRFSSYFCSKDWKLNCFFYFYFKIFIFKELYDFLSCRHMWCEVVHIICKKWFFCFYVKLFTWFMWCISSNNLSLAVRIASTFLSIRWGWGWDFKMLSQELLSHILILLAWKLSWTRKYNTWKWKCHTYMR